MFLMLSQVLSSVLSRGGSALFHRDVGHPSSPPLFQLWFKLGACDC
jgi:hypothetical protein